MNIGREITEEDWTGEKEGAYASIGWLSGVLDVLKVGANVSVTLEDCDNAKRAQLKGLSLNGMTETALNLDEIFEAYVIGNRGRELGL